MEESLKKLIEYIVADYDYEDARNNYSYIYADLDAHGQVPSKELTELGAQVTELFFKRKEKLEALR